MFKYYKNIISCILKSNFTLEVDSQSEKLKETELSNDPSISNKLSEIKWIIDNLWSAEIPKDVKEKIWKIWLWDDYKKIGEANPWLADKLVLELAKLIEDDAHNMKEISAEASRLLEWLREKLSKATSINEIETLTNSEIDKLNTLSGKNNVKVSLGQNGKEDSVEIIPQTTDTLIKIIPPETTPEKKWKSIFDTIKGLWITVSDAWVRKDEPKISWNELKQKQVLKKNPEISIEKTVKTSFKENVPWVKKYLEKDFADLNNPKIDEIIKVLEESKSIKFNWKKWPEGWTSAIFSIQSTLQLLWNNITVDWMYWSETKNAIYEFQKKYNTWKDEEEQITEDWVPWKQTINALLSSLNS